MATADAQRIEDVATKLPRSALMDSIRAPEEWERVPEFKSLPDHEQRALIGAAMHQCGEQLLDDTDGGRQLAAVEFSDN